MRKKELDKIAVILINQKMKYESFESQKHETPIGERPVEDIKCPNCHGSGIDCKECHGWGGLFLDPKNNEPVDNNKQKEITEYWKNIGIERNGNELIQVQGYCKCGYKKVLQARNNPKEFTKTEKEIYKEHDYKTQCPHEPGINVI